MIQQHDETRRLFKEGDEKLLESRRAYRRAVELPSWRFIKKQAMLRRSIRLAQEAESLFRQSNKTYNGF